MSIPSVVAAGRGALQAANWAGPVQMSIPSVVRAGRGADMVERGGGFLCIVLKSQFPSASRSAASA